MFLRYSGSAGAGAVITAALIFGMQQLITTGEIEPLPNRPVPFMGRAPLPPPPPPREPPKPPPERPITTEPPPVTPLVTTDPPSTATDGLKTLGPPTILPPQGFHGGGIAGSGPWIGDGELLLVSRVTPPYPQAALIRDLEGSVVVEFTVTAAGTVQDARVVTSTDRVFERAALSAVARFRYQPRVVDGVAVEVAGVRAELSFELTN